MDMELGRMIEERTNVRIHISTSPVQNYSRYQIYYSKHYMYITVPKKHDITH